MGDSVDNIPGVPGVGSGHGQEVDLDLRKPRRTAREDGGDPGQGRREPRGSTATTRSCRGGWRRSRRTCRSTFEPETLRRSEPDLEKLKGIFSELEFPSLAAEIQGEAAAPPAGSVPPGSRPARPFSVAGTAPLGRRAPRRAAGRRLLAVSDGGRDRDRRGAAGSDRRTLAGARPTGAVRRDRRRQAARRAPRAQRPRRPRGRLRRRARAVRAVPGRREPRDRGDRLPRACGARLLPDKEAGVDVRRARARATRSAAPTAGSRSAPRSRVPLARDPRARSSRGGRSSRRSIGRSSAR